jgi:hypothetical protein
LVEKSTITNIVSNLQKKKIIKETEEGETGPHGKHLTSIERIKNGSLWPDILQEETKLTLRRCMSAVLLRDRLHLFGE